MKREIIKAKGKFVGCDPEFGYEAIFKNGKKVESFEYPKFQGSGIIGYDHCQRVIELRPKPGKPLLVTAEIGLSIIATEKLFKKLNPKIHKFVMISGGFGSPSTGGHVHFDKCDDRQKIINVLNKWEDMKYLECEPGRKQRVEVAGYGRSRQYRDDHPKSIEWRTPSSWLSDPRWAYCMLTLVYSTYFNVDKFDEALDKSYKAHLKYIKSVLSPREWRLFFPYYNMWNGYRLKGLKLPKEVSTEKWIEFLKKIPKGYYSKARIIIEKYLKDCEYDIEF